MNKIDLLGKSFGRLLVISEEKIRDKHGNIRWACKCICGKLVSVIGPSLTKGNTKSCGCFSSDTSVKTHTKHGKSKRSGKSLEYITWDGMIQRCTNPQSSKYRFYGSIGISVCEGWLNFANFLNDMGNRPSKDYTIDRIDFNGNYEPSNCR